MPRIVDDVPDRTDRKYAWNDWADGELREFVKGEDFDTDPRAFANAARNAAVRRKATVENLEVVIRGDSVFLRFVQRRTPLTEER